MAKEATDRRVMSEAVILTMMPSCDSRFSLVRVMVSRECDEIELR